MQQPILNNNRKYTRDVETYTLTIIGSIPEIQQPIHYSNNNRKYTRDVATYTVTITEYTRDVATYTLTITEYTRDVATVWNLF